MDVQGTNAGCRNPTGDTKVVGVSFLASCVYSDFATKVNSGSVFGREFKAGICADRRHLLCYSMLVEITLSQWEWTKLRMR